MHDAIISAHSRCRGNGPACPWPKAVEQWRLSTLSMLALKVDGSNTATHRDVYVLKMPAICS
jgi:hypothetical protein